MRMLMIIVTVMVFSSSALAECLTNARGRTVCSNGEQAESHRLARICAPQLGEADERPGNGQYLGHYSC